MRVGDLQTWNDAAPREKLRIGQRIRVRPGRSAGPAVGRPVTAARATTPVRPATYRVKAGDTLSEIAVRYGVAEADLRRLNRIPANGSVQAGKVLKLR